jgi:hypothetical protein
MELEQQRRATQRWSHRARSGIKFEEQPVLLPEANEPVSFERHIGPMFRQRDRQSMKFVFDLGAYDDVKQHADAILERLRDGSMPLWIVVWACRPDRTTTTDWSHDGQADLFGDRLARRVR